MILNADGLPEPVQTLLCSPAAPIVLTPTAWLPAFPEGIAPGLDTVGIMLPANPLQHLLMMDCQRPLVMTSGNLSGRPPALTNQQALDELSDIADGFLLHNRDILQRMDDSVMDRDGVMLRRARGFVPDAITLPAGFENIPAMICTGADMKNTFCLVRGNQAVLSQHFGDLSDDGVEAQWRSALSVMQGIYAFQPERVVCDAHPGYRARQWAHAQALPLENVHHHHAHAAACTAENGWPLDGGDVIAMTLDGIGMGENGELWGGECLRVNYLTCEHLGGCRPWRYRVAISRPGSRGEISSPTVWRLSLTGSTTRKRVRYNARTGRCWRRLSSAASMRRGRRRAVACLTPSPARWVSKPNPGKGKPPVGSKPRRRSAKALCIRLRCRWIIFPSSGSNGWRGRRNPARAWAFHDALAKGLAELAAFHARRLSLTTVCFSGGVLHNRLLRARLRHYLSDFTLLFPSRLPAGDGAISFGQAVVAAARSCSQRI